MLVTPHHRTIPDVLCNIHLTFCLVSAPDFFSPTSVPRPARRRTPGSRQHMIPRRRRPSDTLLNGHFPTTDRASATTDCYFGRRDPASKIPTSTGHIAGIQCSRRQEVPLHHRRASVRSGKLAARRPGAPVPCPVAMTRSQPPCSPPT